MDGMHWRDEYLTGIEKIDGQHKMYHQLMVQIHQENQSGVDVARMKRLLNELLKYAEYHFCSEENMMIESGYPHLEKHVLTHQQLIAELRDKIFTAGHEATGFEELEQFLQQWFTTHIPGEDARFGRFLKKSGG